MSKVEVRSYLRRSDGDFVPFDDVGLVVNDCDYVSGAIELSIGGVEVLSLTLWDDINWLWPYIVLTLNECRRTGHGEGWFPSQPLKFRAEALGSSGQLLLSVAGGGIDSHAVGPAADIYAEVGRAALNFFDQLHQVCPPQGPANDLVIETARSWIAIDGK